MIRNPAVTWLVLFSLVFTTAFPPYVWGASLPLGDFDNNGQIGADDIDTLTDFLVGRLPSFGGQLKSDFNLDGRIDVADILAMVSYGGDWDGDGIPDASDPFPLKPIDPASDTNGNGVVDTMELVSDGETYADNPVSTTGDIVQTLRVDENDVVVLPFAGATGLDSDGDGLSNAAETLGYSFTYPVSVSLIGGAEITVVTDPLLPDTDRDGLSDGIEAAVPVTDAVNADTDLDGVLDGCDADPLDPADTTDICGDGTMTQAQAESNAAFQDQRVADLSSKGTKAVPGQQRGLGFQGPKSVGSGFESVQSDHYTGAFSYSIPIEVPPGRNGMQPSIDLLYRSSNGPSWLGNGWALEVGRIERTTKNGRPKYSNPLDPNTPAHDNDPFTPLDNPDGFVHATSAGANELVYTGLLDSNTAIYHYCIDSGEFTRFLYHNVGMYWEGQMKDGRKMFFGGTAASNKGTGDINALVEHPTDGIFAWGLDEEWDLNGDVNKITYTYVHPAGSNAMYLNTIGYNYEGVSPKVSIDFELTNRSSDPAKYSYRESYRSGMKVASEDFLTAITETVADRSTVYSGHDDRVRKYSLVYHDLDAGAGRTISCLSSVQEFGEDDFSSYPAFTMAYTENSGIFASSTDYGWTNLISHPAILGQPSEEIEALFWENIDNHNHGTRVSDLNGDGLPDLWQRVYFNAMSDPEDFWAVVLLNQGTNAGAEWQSTSDYAWTDIFPLTVANGQIEGLFWSEGFDDSRGTRIADVNGDGRPDLWQRLWDENQYWEFVRLNQGPGKPLAAPQDAADFSWPIPIADPSSPTEVEALFWNDDVSEDRGGQAADLNGDGLPDLWQRATLNPPLTFPQESPLQLVRYNQGKGMFTTPASAGLPTFDWSGAATYVPGSTQVEGVFWDDNLNSPRGTNTLDVNGDGLTDLWQRTYDNVNFSPNDHELVLVNTGSGFEESTDFSWGTDLPFAPANQASFWYRDAQNSRGTKAADVNGDGLIDLWQRYVSGAVPGLYEKVLLNTGNGFVDAAGKYSWTALILDYPGFYEVPFYDDSPGSEVGTRIVDVNGDGLIDLWQRWGEDPIPGDGFHEAVILSQGDVPNLLATVDNGRGGTVDVEYAAQTRGNMAMYDPLTNQIETNDGIPYVVQCVSAIRRTGLRPNHLNPTDPLTDPQPGTTSESYTTLFRYAGGRHLDREFRGFEKVKEIDAESGNFTISEFHQDYSLKGRVKSVRSYVGDRRDYRTDGMIEGPIRTASEETTPTFLAPKLVTEAYHRYRVVIHEDDPNRLKTFTDTNAKLGDANFPLGVSLITPASALTRQYEYVDAGGNGVDYSQDPMDVESIVTAQEQMIDSRGNLLQSINYGQVDLVPGASLDAPRVDATFTSEASGGNADGTVSQIAEYARQNNGTWMDVPTLVNTKGFYYDDSGSRITESTMLQGSETAYDGLNRPISTANFLDTGADPVQEYDYDAFGNVVRFRDPRFNDPVEAGNELITTYDGVYHVFPATITNSLGHTNQYLFDPGFGNLLEHTDENNQVRSATYDDIGRVTTLENTTDAVSSYEYEFFGPHGTVPALTVPTRIRTITHTPTGDIWKEQHFDGLMREYQTLHVGQRGPSDPVRTVSFFNDRGQSWKTSRPHWLSEPDSPGYRFQIMETDDTANLNDPVKIWAQAGRDRLRESWNELNGNLVAGDLIPVDIAISRLVHESPLATKTIQERGDLNIERRDVLDAFGNLLGVWEPNALGSVGTMSAPAGSLTAFGFDGLGRLEYVRRHLFEDQLQSDDPITRIRYDKLSRRTSIDDPDAGLSVYAYDVNGNITGTTDARGVTIQRQYDAINRMTREAFPDLATGLLAEHLFTYDTGSGAELAGRLARVQSPDCLTEYSYDAEGRTVLTDRTIDSITYTTSSSWDYANRELSKVYPDGLQLTYSYDGNTQTLDRVADTMGRVYLADKVHDQFGLVEICELGNGPADNGVARTYERDATGRTARLLTERTQGGVIQSDLRFTFDLLSNIVGIQELTGPAPMGDMDYSYDSLNRLQSAYGTTMSGEDAGTMGAPRFRYGYDSLGRIVDNSRFDNGTFPGYTPEYSYTNNPTLDGPAHGVREIVLRKSGESDVIAHTFVFDAAGNLSVSTDETGALLGNSLSRGYEWDAFGRLSIATSAAGTSQYRYDHSKKRVKKTDPIGNSVVYVGDIVEVTTAGMTKHVFAGSQRIATIQPGGAIQYYMTDHLSSSTLITDETGMITQRMDYEPYGHLIENARSGNTEGLRHTYTGQETDGETGLMFYRARYYDPVTAGFISADTIVPDDRNPQAYNRYAYVANNPIRFNDPSGHGFLDKIIPKELKDAGRSLKEFGSEARQEAKNFSSSARQEHRNFTRSFNQSFEKRFDRVVATGKHLLSDPRGIAIVTAFALSGGGPALLFGQSFAASLAYFSLGPVFNEVLTDKDAGPVMMAAIAALTAYSPAAGASVSIHAAAFTASPDPTSGEFLKAGAKEAAIQGLTMGANFDWSEVTDNPYAQSFARGFFKEAADSAREGNSAENVAKDGVKGGALSVGQDVVIGVSIEYLPTQ